MPLSEEARTAIARAIDGSGGTYSLSRNPNNVRKLVDGIERELDAAGFVVLTREDLAEEIEEGPYEQTFEDGQ